MMDGKTLTPPLLMAMTNGEASASAEDVPSNLLSSELTNKEIKVKEPNTNTFEPMGERTWVTVVHTTDKAMSWATAADQDNTQDQEPDNGNHLDHSEDIFSFTVTSDTE
ncbi:hypothetical protein WICPIJ_004386 [Wickerhamomyces pijperi]|uniref:Uncharacterized protein n=1 Tax=Wickerhamomyces pijperi TaxID=599730 RepID=A0A9P8Q7R3_WICPI|nr:hypothetical protein WICPIJ_004386 [Wickerhamomyces pijperi]